MIGRKRTHSNSIDVFFHRKLYHGRNGLPRRGQNHFLAGIAKISHDDAAAGVVSIEADLCHKNAHRWRTDFRHCLDLRQGLEPCRGARTPDVATSSSTIASKPPLHGRYDAPFPDHRAYGPVPRPFDLVMLARKPVFGAA